MKSASALTLAFLILSGCFGKPDEPPTADPRTAEAVGIWNTGCVADGSGGSKSERLELRADNTFDHSELSYGSPGCASAFTATYSSGNHVWGPESAAVPGALEIDLYFTSGGPTGCAHPMKTLIRIAGSQMNLGDGGSGCGTDPRHSYLETTTFYRQ